MKRIILIICLLGIILPTINAQHRSDRQEKRFVFMSSIGFASGAGSLKLPDYTRTVEDWMVVINKNTNVMIHQFIGYQFNNNFQLGIGAGIDIWKRTAFIPLYLGMNVIMLDKRVAPVFTLNLGYGFKWYMQSTPEAVTHVIHGSDPGPMGEAAIGLRIRFKNRLSIMFTALYKLQVTSIRYTSNPANMDYASILTDDIKKNQLYHFAGVRVGLLY
ncbi:MAG: hypothetical protein IKQ75_05130 [Bacteroidales bacterium]|nr:hypothetical protein [Bacteroidales bacterium]MBR6161233.1 hypothetical protein [Bacteroidales bacterium]